MTRSGFRENTLCSLATPTPGITTRVSKVLRCVASAVPHTAASYMELTTFKKKTTPRHGRCMRQRATHGMAVRGGEKGSEHSPELMQ